MKLVDQKTGLEIKVGDQVTTFRGEKALLKGLDPPRHEASSGHVILMIEGRTSNPYRFYAGVIGAKYVD